MLIAVEGCAHGELDKIYETVQFLERQQNVKVDLLLCCGDFQAVRNESDLLCMAVPPKYRNMCSFYKYYSGEKQAPILTIFIGGNHEASNHLQELAYGGWVAPNIYYLGYAGVVNIGGIRIAGISGIFKGHDHLRGRFEKLPYSQETMRSAYHVRNLEVFRLKQTKDPIDVFLSHDWPRGIYHYGNTPELLHWKPYFRNEIESNVLGSPAAESLLHELKPEYWFSAHLHVRYQALVPHSQTQATKFLALDKCLPRRRHLELISVNHDPAKPFELHHDPEWLAILRSTNHLLSTSSTIQYMPGPGYNGRWCFKPTEEEIDAVVKLFNNDFKVPLNFSRTVDAYDPRNPKRNATPPAGRTNPQTTEFCRKLGIDDPMEILLRQSAPSSNFLSIDSLEPTAKNPDEIALDDCDDDEEEAQTKSETPVGVEDLFFVDTKPQRTKLSLPEPQTSSGNHENATEDTLIPKPEIPQPAEETSSTPAEEPQPKKFRRRNQEIYTAEIE